MIHRELMLFTLLISILKCVLEQVDVYKLPVEHVYGIASLEILKLFQN